MGRHVLRGRFWRNVTERRSGGRSLRLTLLDPLELGYMLLSLQKSKASISRRILQWSLGLGVMWVPQIPACALLLTRDGDRHGNGKSCHS